jgi:hypothetical protein
MPDELGGSSDRPSPIPEIPRTKGGHPECALQPAARSHLASAWRARYPCALQPGEPDPTAEP